MKKTSMMLAKIFLCAVLLSFSSRGIEGQKITIVGKALNAKLGAIVVSDTDETYYIDGLAHWEKNFYEKKVKVTGRLVTIKKTKKNLGDRFAHAVGPLKTIKNPKWVLVE